MRPYDWASDEPWDLTTATEVSCSQEFWAIIDANWSYEEHIALVGLWKTIADLRGVTD